MYKYFVKLNFDKQPYIDLGQPNTAKRNRLPKVGKWHLVAIEDRVLWGHFAHDGLHVIKVRPTDSREERNEFYEVMEKWMGPALADRKKRFITIEPTKMYEKNVLEFKLI